MNTGNRVSAIHCLAIAAMSLLASAAAIAAPAQGPSYDINTFVYSTVHCSAKNPNHQKVLQPNARGLFNASTKLSVPVLCMIPKAVSGRGCVAGETDFYIATFHVNPSVSRGKAAQVHAFGTNIEWGKFDPQGNNSKAGSGIQADGTAGPGSVIVARKGSTGNPLDNWNGTDKYVSLATSIRMSCDQRIPTLRLTIPPRAFATGIKHIEVRVED